MPHNQKREAYVSIDQDETRILEQLPLAERWLYIKLKWLANFKTGKVGRFGNRILTFASIGKMIGVPSSQGRAAVEFGSGEVRRMLDQLEKHGLISTPSVGSDDGVSFTLLLSPIGANDPAGKKAKAGKLQTAEAAEQAAKPQESKGFEASPEAVSVLMSIGHNNTFFNTDTTDGPGDTPEPRRPTGGDPLNSPLPPAPTGHPMTALEIEQWLDSPDSWIEVLFIEKEDSRKLYRHWEAIGITDIELSDALSTLSFDQLAPPTPLALNKIIRDARGRKNKSSGRGKVAL